MKQSLRLKITIILTTSIIALVLLCILSNVLFLQRFYTQDKVKSLSMCYELIRQNIREAGNDDTNLQEIIKDSDAYDSLYSSLEKLEAGTGIKIYIVNEEENDYGVQQLTFLYPGVQTLRDSKSGEAQRIVNTIARCLFGMGFGGTADLVTIDASNELYNIYKTKDKHLESSYIDLIGYLDDQSIVYLTANYENIEEAVSISNRFLTISGLIVALIGSVLMFFFSKSFTKPIKELSGIADQMSGLNFEAKYTENRRDEIGELGNSINTLSEKLEKTISELKAANIELTRDIENKTEIDEMRKEFLSNVTHELKTPIALIQGYAEGLQDNINDDPESRAFYCDVIIDEATKMNKMVKKLLSLNQLESGRNRLELERFDLTELVNSVAASADIMIRQKEITLVNHFDKPVYVWADEYNIEEVITNYISNAINHIDGNRVIDISYTENEGTVRVSVFNTGMPIPEEELDKIWVKFYKVDKARTREYGGNGIGLSIVKAIMEAHNRECGVINHENGVEFWFELGI